VDHYCTVRDTSSVSKISMPFRASIGGLSADQSASALLSFAFHLMWQLRSGGKGLKTLDLS
ncbi:hypothetical protein, partial [Escherichia coli]